MVNTRSILWFAVLLTLVASVPLSHAQACGEDGDPCRRPFHVGKIANIVIEENWTRTLSNDGTKCEDEQQLTVDDVRRYLQAAGRISEHDAIVKLFYPECSAHGTLITESGRHANWGMGLGTGGGNIFWTDTKEAVHLYCGRC